ncbi:MAG: DUF72 domain-containing protein [Gemmatimonadales bacterium]
MEILTGTSGYSYKEWKGNFYPPSIKPGDMLAYYAERLKCVEINNTFYRMPTEKTVSEWAGQVPDDFVFVIKASRRITHNKRLHNVESEISFLLGQLSVLGQKLGALLFQLPPNLKRDLDRLKEFLGVLPDTVPAAIEFRNSSWFEDEVYELLRGRNIALVKSDTTEASGSTLIDTGDIGYLRLRREEYSDVDLRNWARRIGDQEWSRTFVFFKHEDGGAGPRLAARLSVLAQEVRSKPGNPTVPLELDS